MTADQYLGPGSRDTRTAARHTIGMVLAIPTRLRGLRQMSWTRSLPGAMMPLLAAETIRRKMAECLA
jgi:hypothetical protein